MIRGLLRSILVDQEGFVTLWLFVMTWRWYTPSFLILDEFISDEGSLAGLKDALLFVAVSILFIFPV